MPRLHGKADEMLSLAHKRAPWSSPICQSPHEQCYVTAICHANAPGRGDSQAEWHRGHGCGTKASLYGAGIKPGFQHASETTDINSWGLEQHQLQRETQMELGFGSANAEICRCFFKPEMRCCEWRDVASVSSRLQKRYEQHTPVLSLAGCKKCTWSAPGCPLNLSKHKDVSQGGSHPSPCCPVLLFGRSGLFP